MKKPSDKFLVSLSKKKRENTAFLFKKKIKKMKEYITKMIQINPYTTLEQCLKCKLNRSARRNRVQKVAQKR